MMYNMYRKLRRLGFSPKPFIIGFFIGGAIEYIIHSSDIPSNAQPLLDMELLGSEAFLEDDVPVSGADLLMHQHDPLHEYHGYLDSEARKLHDQVSIYCIVLCTQTNSTKQEMVIKAIYDTWGSRCNQLLFISPFNETLRTGFARVKNFKELNRGSSYMWGRTKAALNFTYHMHRFDADWFFRVDDTNFIIMENIRQFLRDESLQVPLYFGYRMKPYDNKQNQTFMTGAAGIVLNRKALQLLTMEGINNATKCRLDDKGSEDIELGKCLENLGVQPGDSRDNMKRHRFFPFTPENHLISSKLNENPWFLQRTYYPHGSGLDCCSDRAISFHSLALNQIYLFEYFLYHLHPYGISQSYKGTMNTAASVNSTSADSHSTKQNVTFPSKSPLPAVTKKIVAGSFSSNRSNKP